MKEQEINYSLKTKIIIYAILCLITGLLFFFQGPIEKFLNYSYNPNISASVQDSQLKVHIVDVGQGDCIIIEFPDEKVMIIDSGTEKSKNNLIKYINKNIYGAKDNIIDYFLLTHSHEDHVGGATKILENFQIKTIYRPKIHALSENQTKPYGEGALQSENELYNQAIVAINNETCNNLNSQIFANTAYASSIIGTDYKMEFLSPHELAYENVNNYSPMLLLTYKDKKILITGDAEEIIENEIITSNTGFLEKLDIDILKIAHHGSNSSSTQSFLEITSPEYAVISVGFENRYDHPNDKVLKRLEDNGTDKNKTFRTDFNGSVVFGLSNDGSCAKISVSMTYTSQLNFYISIWCVVIVIVFIGFIAIFLPINLKIKKNKKKHKKILKS